MDKKQRFYKVYSNLPLNLRDEIVAVINDEPISWKIARLEIDGETKRGEEILKRLEELKII